MIDLGRRAFLRAGVAAGGGMLLQVFVGSCSENKEQVSGDAVSDLTKPNIWLTIDTGSRPARSASVKSRPGSNGTPSTAKNRGATIRIRACGSSSPFAGLEPSTVNRNPGGSVAASRQGTKLPTATASTPGSSPMRRVASS